MPKFQVFNLENALSLWLMMRKPVKLQIADLVFGLKLEIAHIFVSDNV